MKYTENSLNILTAKSYKGIGNSWIVKNLGHNVIGSDVENHFFTEEGLVENDIKFLTYDENNINIESQQHEF